MGLMTADEATDVFEAKKSSDGSYSVDLESLKSVDATTGEITGDEPKQILQDQPIVTGETAAKPAKEQVKREPSKPTPATDEFSVE